MNCCDNQKIIKKIQTFKNGTNHLRTECENCKKFLGYKQQPISDDYTFPFGKYMGKKISEVEPNYLLWLLAQDWVKNNLKQKIHEHIKRSNIET